MAQYSHYTRRDSRSLITANLSDVLNVSLFHVAIALSQFSLSVQSRSPSALIGCALQCALVPLR